jgi:hypothetical protein
MPGDGVSLPTSVAQLGTVAKTQARAQQTATQVTPFSEQIKGQEDLKVQRVKETSEAEKNRVTGEDQEKDKRKRRRLKRQGKDKQNDLADGNPADSGETGSPSDSDSEKLGSLIDLRV